MDSLLKNRWIPAILFLIGFAYFLYSHTIGLLNKTHYQFLYLLPVLVWMLVIARDIPAQAKRVRSRDTWLGLFIVALSWLGLGTATYLWSPWIAAVSCLVGALGLILSIWGWSGIQQWFPLWIFMWVIIPLPFGMDENLIVRLRGVTTRLSSTLLDQIGILHNSYANVIELPGKKLFIADACSGIHSLYVLFAAALFLIALLRRSLVHSILLLAMTFCVVIAENVCRITSVAILWRSGRDFSMGTRHEFLGFALFCLSVVVIASLDQFLYFFFGGNKFSVLQWIYQKLSGKKVRSEAEATTEIRPLKPAVPILCACFVPLLLVSFVAAPAATPKLEESTWDDFDLPGISKELLPEKLGDFAMTGYKMVSRVPGDPLGQQSHQWTYQDDINAIATVVSVDYPYGGVHDLCVCYESIGWTVSGQAMGKIDQDADPVEADEDGIPIASGNLSRFRYGHGYLLFSMIDQVGNTSAIIKELVAEDAATQAANRFRNQTLQSADQRVPPYVQFQLFARSPAELSADQKQELTKLFVKARAELVKHVPQTTQKDN